MSDSKFLKFQDVDRDGLIDVCDDDLRTPEAPCKGPCVPDPFSIIPDWKKQDINNPFLNTKICHFQITKVTEYNSTAPEELIISSNTTPGGAIDDEIDQSLENKFKEFEAEAINNLLDLMPYGARLNNKETRAIVKSAIEYKKYDLAPNKFSRLKLLYSVPFDILYNLADAPEATIDEGEDEDGPGWEKVTYNADSLGVDSIRVRKTLHFYAKMLRVSAHIGEGGAYFVDSNGIPEKIFHLADYGDPAVFSAQRSVLSRMMGDLKAFMATKGKVIPGLEGNDPFGPIFREKVTKLQFSFKNKELRVLRVWTNECGDVPSVYNKRSGSMRWLLAQPDWKDKTATHYFMNFGKMAVKAGARTQMPWRQYVEQFTYPKVKITKKEMEETVGSCLYGHFRDEINEMGNDILDSVWGLGDLIAYLYNDTLCRSKLEELLEDDQAFNKANPTDTDSPFGREVAAILAKNQKYQKLKVDDDMVLKLCVNAFAPLANKAQEGMRDFSAGKDGEPTIPAPQSFNSGGVSAPDLSGLFKESLNQLKLCGLLDFMFEGLGCLLGGMTLDEALPNIVQAALKAMGIEQFGDLFIGLPPERQRLMDELVKKKMEEKKRQKTTRKRSGSPTDPEEGSILAGLQEGGITGALSSYTESSNVMNQLASAGQSFKPKGKQEELIFERPWENPQVIASERVASSPANTDNYGNRRPASYAETMNEMASGDRTILSSLDANRQKSNQIATGTIMEAYIDALIEVYSENLLEIIDELNNFPGAPLIRDLLSLTPLMCPRPPMFQPGIDDFIKSLDFAFCRKVKEIQIPHWTPPVILLELKTMWADMTGALFRVARFVAGMIVLIVINQIIGKLCDILSRAICKALETTGDILLGLPGAISGEGPSLREIIRENICGESPSDEEIDQTIIEMLSIMALGPAAFADRDKTLSFANDLSLTVTRQEFADALLGNPSPEFLEATDQLLEYVHTDFRDALPNRSAIASFAKGIGNFLPLEYREVLINFSQNSLGIDDGTPANPSICSSPEQLMQFKELRCEIMGNRLSKKQCEELFCNLRDETSDDFNDLIELTIGGEDGGIEDYIADKIPTIIAEPGCDDGLLPFETPEMLEASFGYMNSVLDSLENDYLEDMLGTGLTLFGGGDRNFGFIPMVLSDTKGNNLRAHHRKADNRNNYVDFATNVANGGTPTQRSFLSLKGNRGFGQQEGQYPYYVAEWLKRQFLNAGLSESERSKDFRPGFNTIRKAGNDLRTNFKFKSTNVARDQEIFAVDLDDLGYANLFGRQGISTFTMPDFGYNTLISGINRRIGADLAEGVLDLGMVAATVLTAGAAGTAGSVVAGAAGYAGAGATGTGAGALLDSIEGSTMEIIRLPRKGDPSADTYTGKAGSKFDQNGADINLDFKDNSMGTRKGFMGSGQNENEWSYGFEVQCYYSDIEYSPGTTKLRNRPDDNIRVQIVEKVNYGATRKFASPLAKEITGDSTKLDPFELPPWISGVPIIGWALNSIFNLITLPFSALASGLIDLGTYAFSNKIKRFRAYEFLSIDDGLDAFAVSSEADRNKEKVLNINNFPHYALSTVSLTEYPPQVRALADVLGTSPNSSLKDKYDTTMNQFYKDFAKIIGQNDSGWLYGANFDFIDEEDMEYGVDVDGEFVPYDQYTIDGRYVVEEDMVLGISRNQHRLGAKNARVIYLDPAAFGGTYTNPPVHVKKASYDGWWGMVQAFFPDDTACKPHGKNLINFDEIKEMVDSHYPTLPEDTRLYQEKDCIRQVPFDRILSRSAKMSLYTLILASIRIYASTHIMKSVGTFSAIQPKFPDNFSTIFSAYIVERMEEDFKDAQPAFWENFNVFKDEEFWYAFLEQSVECYDFLVNAGELPLPMGGGYLQRAADTINNLQTHYSFAYRTKQERTYTDENGEKRTQMQPGLWEAKFTGDAGFFDTLRSYRERKNLEGVKTVEDEAKIILQQLVNYELSKMGEVFVKNMQNVGFSPQIFDLDYWLFENKCAGSEIRYAGPKIVDVPASLPSKRNPDPKGVGETFPGPYYTPGGQFRVAVDKNREDEFAYAEEYIGYYHIHMDDDGDEVYMAGAVHDASSPHDIIVPVADIVQVGTIEKVVERYNPEVGGDPSDKMVSVTENIVLLGDVPDYKTGPDTDDEKPFKIEKYVSVSGNKMSTTEAMEYIGGYSQDRRISDAFRGSLRLITNSKGNPVGIEGNIGIRHGLAFYYDNKVVATVEIDALDFKIGQFQPVQPNSKLLHCLLQHLKHNPTYKLLTSYIFSMKKVTGTLAIYNDMGFLASVGEVTTGKGDNKRTLLTSDIDPPFELIPVANTTDKSEWLNDSPLPQVQAKPGSRAFVAQITVDDELDITDPLIKMLYGIPAWINMKIPYKKRVFDPANSGVTGNEGWNHPKNRPNFTPFTLHWDEWDRILLRNSRARIKKLFRAHYYSANKTPGASQKEPSPIKIKMKNLKARIFPAPGAGLLPWWQNRRLRQNPYNDDGELCDGPDILG